ncbi:hypothetical protein M426DRAFT_318654 [Hypoxylon sp. CI-4A]|nr:hypothetical protein M426DRAFT_318654 [Hypoxylon sp. CI-4A]
MEPIQTRDSQIQVPVHSKPPSYRPGDGPPLAPLRIALKHDSDAFIIDKRVFPGTARNGERTLLMYYVVGWQSQPAARIAVLATKIHDYVSPRVVETFEYEASLELDEENERKEAERKRKAEAAAAKKKIKSANATDTSMTPTTPPTSYVQKRRGRPSKAEIQARSLAKQVSYDSSQSIEITMPPASTSGPSLSTPQKKRKGEIVTVADDDMDEADQDDAIYKQLCADSGDAVEEMDMDVDENEEEDEYVSPERNPAAISSDLEIRTYAKTPWLNEDSTLFKSANGNLALKSSTSYVPVPKILRSSQQPPPPPPPPSQLPPSTVPLIQPPPPPPPPSQFKASRMTPVPVPKPYSNGFLTQKKTPTTVKRSVQPNVQPKPITSSQGMTPVPLPSPVPSWARQINKNGESSVSSTPELPRSSLEHYGFTPAGRSTGKWPSTSQPSNHESQRSSQSNASPHLNKKAKPNPSTEKEDKVWVVERLEGHKEVGHPNNRQRYFKVRWAGNWPPGQNPTWEPEDNISLALVKRYMKGKSARRSNVSPGYDSSDDYTPSKSHPLSLKRRYSNVAEAFAGDEEDLDELHNEAQDKSHANNRKYDSSEGDGDEEETFVVTESPSGGRGSRSRKKIHDQDGTAFIRQLAAAINHNANNASTV